jgi:uncharacterized Fe-S cluster protein YjdI
MGVRKEYSNGDVTVVWQPEKCIHAGLCASGLPKVFRPTEKPWISAESATEEELVEQIKKCPSGALSYYIKGEENIEIMENGTKVDVMKNGPLLVHGTVEVNNNGNVETKEQTTAFCRCGASSNKPYCDGSHSKIGFEG